MRNVDLPNVFSWCMEGRHKKCIKNYRPFYIERGKVIYRDAMVYCYCTNKKCECFKQEKPVYKAKRKKKPVEDVELPDG